MRPVPFVRQKMFQRSQEKRAESAALTIGIAQIVLLKQHREKTLSEVLGLISIVTATPDKCIDGRPIDLAQGRQGRSRRSGRVACRSEHEAPGRALKPGSGSSQHKAAPILSTPHSTY